MEPGSVGVSSSARNHPSTDPTPWRTSRRHARKPRVRLIDLTTPRKDSTGSLSTRAWYPGATCGICGEGIRTWQQFNWDHSIPLSQGGPRGRVNKRLTHLVCNSVKGNQYPFSLRTPAERAALAAQVRPGVYARLERVWRGERG